MEMKILKYEKACGAVIYDNRNEEIKYLIIKQKRHGDWVFPKGHVEAGETEEETALREVFEETGLKVKLIGDFRYSLRYIVNQEIDKEVIYFTAYPIEYNVNIQESEVEEYKWANYDEIIKFLSHESLKNVFIEAVNSINANEE